MNRSTRIGGFVLLLAASLGTVGCQTYQLGQVLPSGYHLRDDIQYFPKGPEFPLSNELNAMTDAERDYRESQR